MNIEKLNEIKETLGAEVFDAAKADLEKEYQEQLDKHIAEMNENNRIALDAAITEFKKQQMPPTTEDISKMLNQEYQTYTVKLFDGASGTTKEFTICEMPLGIERKLYAMVRDKVIPRIKDLNLIQEQSQYKEETIQAFFMLIDPASELLAEACAIVLDPWGKDASINKDWVLNNLSSVRIWNIITAQMEVNKMRDFFSGVSRTSQKGKMSPVVSIRR